MDSLFREYANPFILLDEVIQCGQLNDFLNTFSESQEEKVLWDMYCYKLGAFDNRSFEEFKHDMTRNTVNIEVPKKEKLETTIKHSFNIMKNFEFDMKGGE